MKIRNVEDIVKSDLCIGCGICLVISEDKNSKMVLNEKGFYEPSLSETTNQCFKTIKKVCPGINLTNNEYKGITKVEQLWGKVRFSCTGHAIDEKIRWEASSGGAISAILLYMVENKIIDYAVHLGQDINNPLKTRILKSRKRSDILRGVGSRYAPTPIFNDINDLIEYENSKIALVGKPCDIAGITNFLNIFPKYRQNIKVLISFFCAGIPSLNATEEVINRLGVRKDNLKGFRYRGHGWPGYTTAIDRSGKEYKMSYNESWGNILNKQLHFRCKICPDGVGEFADIVCGDAWYSKNGYPDFDEQPGRSLILVRTEVGEQIISSARENNYLETGDFNLHDLSIIQPYQKERRESIFPRLLALILLGYSYPRFNGFYLLNNFLRSDKRLFFSNFFGMIRRIITKYRTVRFIHNMYKRLLK
jgi:coenzyme F420 hydrogenase subunit beta